jgi:hypothetical protein
MIPKLKPVRQVILQTELKEKINAIIEKCRKDIVALKDSERSELATFTRDTLIDVAELRIYQSKFRID